MNPMRAFLIYIFSIFMLTGLWFGYRWIPPIHSDQPAALGQTPGAPMIQRANQPIAKVVHHSQTQRILLLFCIDAFEAEHPQLTCLWEIISSPTYPALVLMPIYPSLQGSDPITAQHQGANLAQTFRLVDRHIDPGFLETLKAMNYAWDGYIMVDQVGLDRVLHSFLPDKRLTKDLSELRSLSANDALMRQSGTSQNSVVLQTMTMQRVCTELGRAEVQAGAISKLSSLFDELDNHVSSDLEREHLLVESGALLTQIATHSCDFPGLQVTDSFTQP